MLLGSGVDKSFHYFVINKYWSNLRLFISRLEIDSFSFFLHGLFVLEYADLSHQRDLFSRFIRFTNMSNQIKYSIARDRKKNFAT